jgi:hypothetical protein
LQILYVFKNRKQTVEQKKVWVCPCHYEKNKINERVFATVSIFNTLCGVAKLANVSVVHPRDPGSNIRVDRIFFYSVRFRIDYKSVGGYSWALFVNIWMYIEKQC